MRLAIVTAVLLATMSGGPVGAQSTVSPVPSEPPAVNLASPTWLDRAEFPRLGLAIDRPLADMERGGACTVDFDLLAPFSGSEASPTRSDDPRSRLGGSFTLGGPTAVTKPTPANRNTDLTDHFTAEVKLRVLGQDRPSPVVESPELGLSLSADHNARGYGLDYYTATMIAELPRPFAMASNVGYRVEEEVREQRNEEVKLAIGTSRCLRRSSSRSVNATVNGGELIRNHGRSSVRIVNSVLDVPFTDALTVTASMTCSNRPERIGQGVVRGCLGLSYDMTRSAPGSHSSSARGW